MIDKAKIIKWASGFLVSEGFMIERAPEVVIETPWSTVIQFLTSNGYFYLKQTPEDLFIEPKIIKAIQKNISDSLTPTILLINNELNFFIMKSCGDYSLRTLFDGAISADLLIKGLRSYIYILRSFDENLQALEPMSVPDWRFNHIPQLYVELLENNVLLINEGITQDELDKLMGLVNSIKSICKFLSEQKVRNTLVNCDFNENNMIVNEHTQQISIVDWGRCVITHPFFCSLALYGLQAATGNKSKEMQNWFIASFLRTLINKEREGALLLRRES